MPQNATPKLNLRFKCNEHSSYINITILKFTNSLFRIIKYICVPLQVKVNYYFYYK